MSRWTDILRANVGKIRNPDESTPNDPSRNVLIIGTELVLPGSQTIENPPPVLPPSVDDSSSSSGSIVLLFGAAIVLLLVLNSKKGKRK
jgi:hypothetical protein